MTPAPSFRSPSDRRLLPLRDGETPIAAFALAGIAASTTLAVGAGGYEFLFYIAVVGLIMLVVSLIHRRVRLSHASLWALLAWAGLHMAGGMFPVPAPAGVLYNLWLLPGILKYDQLIHAYGFGVTAWVCWQVLAVITPVTAHRSPVILAAAALSAMGLGALNEEIEFLATKLVEKTNVGDYDNNAWDLVCNMTGAVVAVAVIASAGRPSRASPTKT